MAFVKKTWKDRVVQYANRRLLTKSGGEIEQVVVTRDEGTVTEAGDKFDAATMNDLEDRLEYAFDNVSAAIECTQAEYDTWKNAGQLKLQTTYIIKDAQNLNPTASDMEYSSGVSVEDELDDLTAYKPISYTPTTDTVTISTSFFSGACKVIVARAYDTYDANIEFIAGANSSNVVICEIYKGSAVTIARVDGKTFTINESGLSNATIIIIPYRGDWNISG